MANLALPGNPRYQPRSLQKDFGYDNLYRTVIEVELATMRTLGEIDVIPSADMALLTPGVEQELFAITTTEVDRVERTDTQEYGPKTGHDVRALVRIANTKLPPRLRRWTHIPLTSFDPLDTGRILQFVRAHQVVRGLTDSAIACFVKQTRRFANTPQIGRTHGQHALPVTVGFWFATILSRIINSIKGANEAAGKLVGKISGAVGAYNAQVGLGIAARCGDVSFEERVLAKLGLRPAPISTQILPPEPLAEYLFWCVELSGAFGQFGRDGRNLMRTEIGELCEPFEVGQVGSSTMAAKQNPINFENTEGTWLKNKSEFGKVLDYTISEHQRDLVGNPLARDFPIIPVNVVHQCTTLLREADGVPFILRIAVDEDACARNLAMQGDFILAEPLYIALQSAGYGGDAHALINDRARAFGRSRDVSLLQRVIYLLRSEEPRRFQEIWNNIPPETLKLFERPESYVGDAPVRALAIADMAEAYLAGESGE